MGGGMGMGGGMSGGGMGGMSMGGGTTMGGFNRWANSNINYQSMNGFVQVDYSGGWNPNVHDMMLKRNIQQVYQRYDMNHSGQLEG